MFHRRFRLNARGLFQRTLRQGWRYYQCPYFSIIVLPHWKPQTPQADDGVLLEALYRPRVGFVISKKVDKRATRRNRIKRVVREHLRQHVWPDASVSFEGVATLAFIFREEAAQASADALRDRLDHAFSPRQLQRLYDWLKERHG